MQDSMKGLFFIMKGQYKKGVEPSFNNTVSNEVSYIGGYDPYSETTEEWYMLLDCKTFTCVSCGGDLDKVLKGVYNTIKKYKGVAKKYFKHISEITSDDYYHTHYLGEPPFSDAQVKIRTEGRCPRVSPVMRCLFQRVYDEYGDFYSDLVEEMEDLAYEELKEEKPLTKARKLVSKNKTKKTLVKTPKEEKVINTPTLKKMVKPRVKMGVKKLPMN